MFPLFFVCIERLACLVPQRSGREKKRCPRFSLLSPCENSDPRFSVGFRGDARRFSTVLKVVAAFLGFSEREKRRFPRFVSLAKTATLGFRRFSWPHAALFDHLEGCDGPSWVEQRFPTTPLKVGRQRVGVIGGAKPARSHFGSR